MADEPGERVSEMDVQLNEAFARLERKDQPPRAAATTGPMVWLAIGLSLFAVGLGSYASYTLYRGDDGAEALADDVDQLRRQFADAALQRGAIATDLEAYRQQQTDQVLVVEESLQAVETSMQASLKQIEAGRTTTASDWLLAEVEYLLRMASQRILMDRDPSGAAALLRASDRILVDAEHLTAHGLREAIALDLATLEAAGDLDVEGIYLRISAQIGIVAKLERPIYAYVAGVVTEDQEPQSTSLWATVSSLAVRFGQTLASLVDFRRNMPEITPVLPPNEEYYLRQNLILKLQMAQLGLLRQRDQVYQTNIKDAVDWLDRYFDADHAATMAMRQALVELADVEVASNLPDVARSLQQVRILLAKFHSTEVADE